MAAHTTSPVQSVTVAPGEATAIVTASLVVRRAEGLDWYCTEVILPNGTKIAIEELTGALRDHSETSEVINALELAEFNAPRDGAS